MFFADLLLLLPLVFSDFSVTVPALKLVLPVLVAVHVQLLITVDAVTGIVSAVSIVAGIIAVVGIGTEVFDCCCWLLKQSLLLVLWLLLLLV